MRRLGLVLCLLSTACFRNLDFAPCQENPDQALCHATDAAEAGDTAADDGVDAPIPCTDAGPSTEACGNCGTRTRMCRPDGNYDAWGACTGEGPCKPGEVQLLSAPACDRAFETRSRQCSTSCVWAADACALKSGWHATSPSPLDGRASHSGVWDGKEVIVWGGRHYPEHRADGAKYDPQKDAWTPVAASPLSGRTDHTAVWTGSKMIIFGGEIDSGSAADGAAYDPVTNSWKKIGASPLGTRQGHSAVWSGKEMLVIGGVIDSSGLPVAAAYDPVKDSWRALPDPPTGAGDYSGLDPVLWVWTGTNAIALSADPTKNVAARYDPATNKWAALPSPAGPHSRPGYALRDKTLFAFGGFKSYTPSILVSDVGLRLDDGSWTWKPVEAPSTSFVANPGRVAPNTWCSSTTCYFWSGIGLVGGTLTALPGGAAYDMAAGTWSSMDATAEPLPTVGAAVAWTGDLAVVWGGTKGTSESSDGAVFIP